MGSIEKHPLACRDRFIPLSFPAVSSSWFARRHHCIICFKFVYDLNAYKTVQVCLNVDLHFAIIHGIKIITSTKIISFRKIFSAERQYFGVVHNLMSASMDTNFWIFSKVSIIYNVHVQNIREIRGPRKQTNFIYKKIFVLIMSGQAGSPQIYLANQRSTNKEWPWI